MTELMIRDGDYVPDGTGGLARAEGNDAILQRVLWKLTVRRGSFPFLPELGSRLYLLPREKPGNRLAMARQYVQEALEGEDGLEVTGVELTEEHGMGLLKVELTYEGAPMTAGLALKE
ncbi:hypothetical protein WMO64_13400 [Pseudoflavonifractor sp. CLA-AP-H29]|uniref:DUF2634 domain-containing protein n=1 Tax=Pseudoflavonifractor intestinihominis TaxID=3133171 RepID=A0ABV1EAZ8_9FIRM